MVRRALDYRQERVYAVEALNAAAGGWAQMPRTVPMIASLLDTLDTKAKPGRLYIVLWAHAFSDGFVEVADPWRLALEAGYTTKRAERTFNERMRQLRELGFIRSEPLGNREFGYVLLIDPHRAVLELQRRSASSVPNNWFSAFIARCLAIGVNLPDLNAPATLPAAPGIVPAGGGTP